MIYALIIINSATQMIRVQNVKISYLMLKKYIKYINVFLIKEADRLSSHKYINHVIDLKNN